MAQTSVEDHVQEVINSLMKAESIEEAFCGYIVQSEGNKRMRRDSCLSLVRNSWEVSLPKETHDAALKYYVTCIHGQTNARKVALLLDMLDGLVATNVISAKNVCEALLSCEQLTYKDSEKWCQTFKLVRKIISQVDYKGCRDFLKMILEKTQNIPCSDNVHTLHLLDIVCDVVAYILDRDQCLLPGYFAVNEITRLFSEDKPWPHWKLGQLLSEFVQSFRSTAQLVTVSGRSQLLPVVGHSSSASNVWKLSSTSLRFPLQGPLPYDKELYEPQRGLLRYVLEQPYSRDMVRNMLSLIKQVKQRCLVLEDELVNLVVTAMEKSETEDEDGGSNQLLWQHLSSQLIYFVLFQFASFPYMVMSMYEKLKGRNLRKGRDHLMWVLLQFISGSINKTPLEDFLPVMRLYDLLYPEQEPLPVPDCTKASSTIKMAVTCIWIHLDKKAKSSSVKLQRSIPHALNAHIEFLRRCMAVKTFPLQDYKIALLCNAFSTNTELFSLPMGILMEGIHGNQQTPKTTLPGNIQAAAPTVPLRLDLLDSLTVHAKMSLIHSIVMRVLKVSHPKTGIALAPALLETYSRLLVYMEIESLGIKGFISQVLPNVLKGNAWGILHTLLEMFSYRLHHIQPHYRVQLLSQLQSLNAMPQTNRNQLHLCIESTTLRLIMGLGSWEVQPQLSTIFSESKSALPSESEEINRVLILTLARAIHVTGSESISGVWCRDILNAIMQSTPHKWSSHTLDCFPPALAEFFQENVVEQEDNSTLKSRVETECRKWKSMASENDLISHFSMQGTTPLFLCVLWKSLLEDNRISPTAQKVLERLGPRALSAHVRTFADYLVHEFSTSQGSQQINKCVESLNDLIWKCNVVPIDRLVLCMALRPQEGNEAQVCSLLIQLLLLKPPDFRNRVHDFIRENSPEHWLQSNWHEKHMNFHKKYPERFYYEGLQDMSQPGQHQYLPVYFGNVCLRFLPVFDIVIHRFLQLQMSTVIKSLEIILDHLGGLYKFHDRPVTFLYNTLHYYEKKLTEMPTLKKKLVNAIIGSLKDIRPANWCLSEEYQAYLLRPADDTTWVPEQEYYMKMVGRLVDTISGKNKSPFPNCDWRFNEFPNLSAHALHATCVELMALPVNSQSVGGALLDIILKGAIQIRDKAMEWMNAIGLILTALPSSYWMVLNDRIQDTLQRPTLASPPPTSRPFQAFNFSTCHQVAGESSSTYMLALCHAVWQHSSIGQLSCIPKFMKEKLKPLVKTEDQFLFVCHLVGPFLQRFHAERTKCVMDLTVELYEMLDSVDKNVTSFRFMDPISDFLYHIKYMFVGNAVKIEVERLIGNLRPALQQRLRFISHQGKEEATSA